MDEVRREGKYVCWKCGSPATGFYLFSSRNLCAGCVKAWRGEPQPIIVVPRRKSPRCEDCKKYATVRLYDASYYHCKAHGLTPEARAKAEKEELDAQHPHHPRH